MKDQDFVRAVFKILLLVSLTLLLPKLRTDFQYLQLLS